MDELRAALELATEDELRDLTEILFRPKFNPIDYVRMPHPIDIQSQDRDVWLESIEQRFRFLAANGITVLSGRTDQITYRDVLVQVCRHLHIPYKASMSTTDLEAEVFLDLLGRAWKRLPAADQQAITVQLKKSLTHAQLLPQLPLSLQQDPASLLLKGGTALAVTSLLRPILLQQIARQFALHFATYQMARQAVAVGGVAAAQLQSQIALQVARRGMSLSAARYTAVRSVFACLGPALWVWFFADLGWRSIATNYGRVIPTVYALAQIRLIRAACLEPA